MVKNEFKQQIITAWLRESVASGSQAEENQNSALLYLWEVTLPLSEADAETHRAFAFTASTGGLAQAVSAHTLSGAKNQR